VHHSKIGAAMADKGQKQTSRHPSGYVRFTPEGGQARPLARPLRADFVAKVIDGFRSK